MVTRQDKTGYRPSPAPLTNDSTLAGIIRWAQRELSEVARSSQEISIVELRVLYTPPEKPRAGMLVYADGTEWNPGSGEGVYRYNLAGTWAFVG